jgi:hypothetical protein
MVELLPGLVNMVYILHGHIAMVDILGHVVMIQFLHILPTMVEIVMVLGHVGGTPPI